MREVFHQELEDIERRLAEQSGRVERALVGAVEAFAAKERRAAREVIKADAEVNQEEVAIERTCFDAIARQQPMARDLRFLTGVIKINHELERIGDLASSIARRAQSLTRTPTQAYSARFMALGELARGQISGAMDAFLQRDPVLARSVWRMDEDVNAAFHKLVDVAFDIMRSGQVDVEEAHQYVIAARHLERVGDYAQNMAEETLFIVEGKIVRHNAEGPITPAG